MNYRVAQLNINNCVFNWLLDLTSKDPYNMFFQGCTTNFGLPPKKK